MTIDKIYTQYDVMPTTQTHMIRVACLALLIDQNWKGKKIHLDEVLKACLLHDIANIVKSSLKNESYFGVNNKKTIYWKAKRDEFAKKYGDNEIKARKKIFDQLNLSSRIKDIIALKEFKNAQKIYLSDSEVKISYYSDFRIGPFGLLSIEERFLEAKSRSLKNSIFYSKKAHSLLAWTKKIEESLQENISTNLNQINLSDLDKHKEAVMGFQFI